MQDKRIYLLLWIILLSSLNFKSTEVRAYNNYNANVLFQQTLNNQKQDTLRQDSAQADSVREYQPSKRSTYQIQDRYGDPFSNNLGQSPFLLGDPSALSLDVEIDTGLNYTIYEKIGDINFRPTSSMTFEEFSRYQEEEMLSDYWKERSLGLDGESAVSGRSLIPPLYVSPAFDRLFGGSFVEIIPNGFVTLDFGGRYTKNENPNIPVRSQRYSSFEFEPQINMNAVGKVGEKLAVTANFANNNSFDYQNDLKVEYTGYEEEIIKKIEIGNVSMPVNNSLITGAQNLFGVKTQLQFGHLYVTSVASTQRGTSETLTVSGGKGQRQEFEVRSSDYDENRHFFLGHFFRDNYEKWLSGLPNFTSGVNITRVEVFVINRTQNTNAQRRIAAFMDLGEANPINMGIPDFLNEATSSPSDPTDNEANTLWDKIDDFDKNYDNFLTQVDGIVPSLTRTRDFEIVNVARKLEENEYSFHQQLGYLSLQRQLQNDELLAVSYEFSYNGQRYTVGELSETYGVRTDEEVAVLKLLRPSKINVDVPTWDLMMKNVYNLPGNQITEDGFELRIIYRDDRTGQDNPSLHESSLKDVPLLRLFNLDSLNQNGDPQPDGNFDYIPNVTIDERDGRIVFPVLEPFGQSLNELFLQEEQTFRGKYVFNTLYESTKNDAQQLTSKDKFFIKGHYASGSATEIALPGINISPESVIVSSGGTQLQPNIDYKVDPNLGRVTILNQGILNSGRDIQISFEREDLFNFQSKSLIGTRLDYVLSEKVNFGATVLRHTQRPLGVSRYAIGSEPTNNTKWGVDINYSDEVPFLTKMVDMIPFIDTKAPSTVTFRGEFAQMIPGTSNEVNGEGASYIDDFEQSVTLNNLGSDVSSWNMAATPETTDNRFSGSGQFAVNNKRAKLAWYQIEQTFYFPNGPNVPNVPEASLENHYSRNVVIQEIYKNRDQTIGNNNLQTFDLAYYPTERGMYNYSTDLSSEGKLLNPKGNWAGITRAITSEVDFDKSNIEYIEFWLMDPFIQSARGVVDSETPNTTPNPGKLIFNLGSVSEDILPDQQLAFENGLPEVYTNEENVSITEYGRVPTDAPVTQAFSNQAGARANQDVGLDGVRNDEEAEFYADYIAEINNSGLNAAAKNAIIADPSADNFAYFLNDEYDSRQATILERYKSFNNYEGNTPISTGEQNFNPSGSRTPDSEDLNNDRTVATLEEYYQYDINLSKADLSVADNPLIVDEAISEEEGVKWYLFRIPIRTPTSSYGGISGYKSIRYIRTLMTGFERPVILRMADFRLVGSQWREYQGSLSKSGVSETPEDKDANLVVSVVSVEANSENGVGKVPYVLPPGIQRDQDVSASANQVRQNEQSLQLCVDDFEDGESVAAFKNINFDLVNYGRLKMFLHAQSPNVVDDEVLAFVRMGTDFEDNYYEIELPLKVTPYQSIDPSVIWPAENEISLAFDQLYQLKSRRNRLSDNVTLPFTEQFGKYNLTVRGRPDMSSVQTIMIGIRNPRGGGSMPKSVCVWANEMRVTDFDQTSGWAANATLNTQLADFANITTSTRYTSVGFGGIEQNISQRTREASTGFDVSANISLGKFFKEKSGIKIPMYLGYQTFTAVPFYDPRDPDIPLTAALEGFDNAEDREEYRNIVIEQEQGRSINFTNVRKERGESDKLALPIAISNFDFTYAYSEFLRSNLQTAAYETKNYKGAIGYNYTFPNGSIAPFESSESFTSPYLKLIKDININPLPASFGFRAELNRSFVKTQLRNADLTTNGIDAQFEKSFTMSRSYNLNWNLTQNLNINYTARAFAIIDEPAGELNEQYERDSVLNNLQNLGRMKTFDQSVIAGYQVPLDKIPVTDWISADLRYKVDFNWTSGSLGQIDSLGHVIQNSSEYGVNGRLDLNKLYNKVKLLNRVNNPPRLRAGQQDTTFQQPGGKLAKGLLRFLMSVKNITGTYSVRGGTLLPGYKYRPFLFGYDSSFSAPGPGFLMGSQDPSIRYLAADNEWLTQSTSQNAFFTQSTVETINLKAILEPVKDLNVQLDFNRVINDNYQENFRYTGASSQHNGFESLTPTRSGNFIMSYNMISTAFVKNTADNSPLFEEFVGNKEVVLARLNAFNQEPGSYQLNQQDVLIPAFLAAYRGQSASEVDLNPIPEIPLPNWRVDYKGLTNIKAIKDVFPSVTVSHSYVSTFSINNYVSNSIYGEESILNLENKLTNYPLPTEVTDDGAFLPVYNIGNVILSEKFSPLIGINIRTKGRLTAKAEYRKERNLSLSTSTAQLTDQRSNDFVLDIGFTDPSFKLPFKVKGRVVSLKNDLTMQLSVTVRNTEIVQRSINDQTSTIVDGNINFQVRPTVNYTVNERLNLNLYYQRSFNEPKLTNSFPSTNTTFGVQIRFGLQ